MSARLWRPSRPALFASSLPRSSGFVTAARRPASTGAGDEVSSSLREALKAAMRGKDKLRTNAIKSALADVQNAQKLANPPAPLKTLRLAISRRIEAAQALRDASRTDLAGDYETEARVLEELLPQRGSAMGEDELGEVVGKIVETTQGAKEEGLKALGTVIKAVREQVGDRAEGKQIAMAVKKALSG